MSTTSPTMSVYQSTAPTWEPLTIAEVKGHIELAASSHEHDDTIERLIKEARETVETDTGWHLAGTRTIVEKLDNWPVRWIELRARPVTSVTSITYVDTSGVAQTWTNTLYVLDLYRVRPSIRLAYLQTWPTLRGDESGIVVTYVAGYASRAVIPEAFKQACLLRVAENFDDRTGQQDPRNVMIGRKSAYEHLIARLMRSSYP